MMISFLLYPGISPAKKGTDESASVSSKGETAGDGLISATPRFFRSKPRTEVFFSDLQGAYWLNENDRNYGVFLKAFIDASERRAPVRFEADPRTRQILKVQGVKEPAPLGAAAASEEIAIDLPPPSIPRPAAPVFMEIVPEEDED